MKTYGGVDVQLNGFLACVLDEAEWQASLASTFIPGTKKKK